MPSRVAACLVVVTVAGGCVPKWKRVPHATRLQRESAPVLHEQVEGAALPVDWWNHILHSTVTPLGRTLSPSRWANALTGGRESLDRNAFDEVVDSTWFENRISRRPLTPEEVGAGPHALGPPADGPLTVIAGKTEGVTPGAVIEDSLGRVWFVKFDPPAFPSLTTGAEIVAQRLLWAAGYHVPEMYLRTIDLYRLRLDPAAMTLDEYNRVVPLTEKRLRDLLTLLNPQRSGRLRALFSRQMPGVPVGPFAYRGLRLDDPNDRIPHERRRSLRGLWLFSAWLNNTDTRRQNSMDVFVPTSDDGRGYLMHYLMDFGDALGAAGTRTKFPAEGHEHFLDWRQIGWRLVTLGLTYPYWIEVAKHPSRAVGVFESDVFDPERWSPVYSNPAFVEATARDTFWAASIIARLDDVHIEAAVAAAAYEPPVARWVERVLRLRRDKVLRYAFAHALPLIEPSVEGRRVRLQDLEAERGWTPPEARFGWRAFWNRSRGLDVDLDAGGCEEPHFDLTTALTRVREQYGVEFERDPFVTLEVWRERADGQGPSVAVHLRVVGDGMLAVGLEREVE